MLRCGVCRQRRRLYSRPQRERTWRDLSLRDRRLLLRYRPFRVRCPRCGVRVEDFPWAGPWERVTKAFGRAVTLLARQLSGQETTRPYPLNWKTVAATCGAPSPTACDIAKMVIFWQPLAGC